MSTKKIRIILLVGVIAAVLLATFVIVMQPGSQATTNTIVKLQAPSFVGIAQAGSDDIAYFMEDEAGIACYFQASSSIDLNDVRDAFRTIEVETADYIIGSVPVIDYPESEDVHVYVHTDGWVVAYYLAADPVGKIFDWRVYHNTGRTEITTKLENTLILIASEAFVPFTSGTFYDFRHPNATHLMLIAEWASGGTDEFEVNLPGTFVYFERSWSLGSDNMGSADFILDSITIFSGSGDWGNSQGILSASQLLTDQFHTIGVHQYYSTRYSYGGLALVYMEP
jgi:hypothetical protein